MSLKRLFGASAVWVGTGMKGNAELAYSNSDRGKPDCLMIDLSVPVRSSRWSGTGTVTVPVGSVFCITT